MDSPLVIPIFIPHSGCPHLCSFCNQSIITGQKKSLPGTREIESIIAQYLLYKGCRSRVELAFFGGNFLGLAPEKTIQLLEVVSPYVENGTIHGIRCSTRPDTITPQSLDLIAPYGVSLVELGVQSMNDHVLERVNRGHTSDHTRQAIRLLKKRGIKVGVQVMVGLPDVIKSDLLQETMELAALQPDVARIYPLMVLAGSSMARWYAKGEYTPLTLDQSIDLVKEMYKIFVQNGVDVIRMGLQASEMMDDVTQVLAGPWHPAFGHLVFSAIFYDRILEKIRISGIPRTAGQITLLAHPRFESRLRGDKNSNIARLKSLYPGVLFTIETQTDMALDEVDIRWS